MDKVSFEKFVNENPDKTFCLHNGFEGFGSSSPSNPKWISAEKAFKILKRYETLTGVDPLSQFDWRSPLKVLLFERKAWILSWMTGYKMIGFNREQDVIYGMARLGFV